jgi:hypothetical protein
VATIDIFTTFVCVKTTHKMKLLFEHTAVEELKKNNSISIGMNLNKEMYFGLLKIKFNTDNKKNLEGVTFNLRIEYNFWGESRFRFIDYNKYEFTDDLSFTQPFYQPELLSKITINLNLPVGANADGVVSVAYQYYDGFPELIQFDVTKDGELIKLIESNDVLEYGNLIRQYDGESLLRYKKTYQNYIETNNLNVLKKNLFDYYIVTQATILVGMGRLKNNTLVNELEPFLEGYSIVKEANQEHLSNPRPDWEMLKITLKEYIGTSYSVYYRFNNYITKLKSDSEKWGNYLLLFDQFRVISKTHVDRLVAVIRELAEKEAVFKLIQINISDWYFDSSFNNNEVLTINLKLIPGYEEASDVIDSTIKFSISSNLINYCIEYNEEICQHTSYPEKFIVTERPAQIVYTNRIASLPDWKNAGYEFKNGLVCRPELERNKLEEKAYSLIKKAILNEYFPNTGNIGFYKINKESDQTKK